MSIFFSVLRTAQVFAICLILTACSGSPSIGEQMVEQSGAMKAVGEDWLDGEELVKKGESLIDDGEDDIDDGEDLISRGKDRISKGKSLISEGKALMKESEAIFKKRQAGL